MATTRNMNPYSAPQARDKVSKSYRVLVVHAKKPGDQAKLQTGRFVDIDRSDGGSELLALQNIVGGLIEVANPQDTLGLPRLDFYCNENGRSLGLPKNDAVSYMYGSLIIGDVAFACGIDDAGEVVGIDDVAEMRLLEWCAVIGVVIIPATV